ncbi:uncharacterized protein PHALS_00946 [Plasmopara halstedii]|uniref:Uncharacterized protein n=1 Tax=Plasmopara halstedii TaxID=4781 RepID=A0A0P1ASL5_PLAHL|nr:uncharacterized protein PHALS_00946 [Plasmopara halstedii]CEG44597.1 hypothetical protein PHALS_00946 [Plasmopara halstedii]|eukprot:XP_024580966.1 hypothetical protein PHALS_00946 [Plasmopara halstedii]
MNIKTQLQDNRLDIFTDRIHIYVSSWRRHWQQQEEAQPRYRISRHRMFRQETFVQQAMSPARAPTNSAHSKISLNTNKVNGIDAI